MSHRECWVTMNDGVRLDTSIFTPSAAQPEGGWPAILLIHGHGDTGSKASMFARATHYAQRGYLVVAYSVRGQGCSEGLAFHLGAREVFDLQDVIDWLLAQLPVHPQKLAVCGSSQGGWHAYMAAAHHPQVATVVPENIVTDLAEFAVRNGCLTRWFFLRTMRRRMMSAGLQDLARQWAIRGEWERLQEWVRPTSPRLFVKRMRCPIFILHGWHDMGMPANEVLTLFDALNVPKKLYLGGGGHEGQDIEAAAAERTALIDRWLDHWLLGEANGIMDEPAITYVRRPSWESVQIDAIPSTVPSTVGSPTVASLLSLYLHADGSLQEQPPANPDTHANVNNVLLDPDYTLHSAIYDDMAGVATALARETVTYTSAPLGEAHELLGAPQVTFYMLANHSSYQVHAELYDIAPSGEANLITRGHYGTRRGEPGHHVTVTITCRTIGYYVAAGHHLRLVVSNYDTNYVFPYFDPFCIRLYHDNGHPSVISLPWQPIAS